MNQRLIESDGFAFDFLSQIAEKESWRKEIYRPIYHIHKWWAKRLGSVFRGIILGCLLDEGSDLESEFYKRHNFDSTTIFDPFMGSGTTIGEAHKLGCTALGCDINPVACESVRVALGPLDRHSLKNAFDSLYSNVGMRILNLYKSKDNSGQDCDVLYFFWVKQVLCPRCNYLVDLFNSRIFAKNAYPNRKPHVHVSCPECGGIFRAHNNKEKVRCIDCSYVFSPHQGNAFRSRAICKHCEHEFTIINAIREAGTPPLHRLYAKLVLTSDNNKMYLKASKLDISNYERASGLLKDELNKGVIRMPSMHLLEGYNTNQAIGYNYKNWHDFFNDRQLLALGWLNSAIAEIKDEETRDAFFILFSGVLEFNNMFASYKGEGTGAVRHMFSHHILKPERMPIEANIWGTNKSSGSFSTLFKTRILRALDYREQPFEIKLNNRVKKIFGANPPFSGEVENWASDNKLKKRGIYILCDSSTRTNLPEKCIDLIITDPPFFDNVHYSELADFFFAWQSLYPRGFIKVSETTRDRREVQDSDSYSFSDKLCNVFKECHRILSDKGFLVFTYHHSRKEGWTALLKAVINSGFIVTNNLPIKSEMSVASPKSQAKEPIQLDIIFVCKKRDKRVDSFEVTDELLSKIDLGSNTKISRLSSIGLNLSKNDKKIILLSELISKISLLENPSSAEQIFTDIQKNIK